MQKVNGRGLDSALFMPVNFTFYQYILNIYEENQNNMFHFYINYHINIYINITFLLNPRRTHTEASPCPCAVYSSARLTIFLGVPLYNRAGKAFPLLVPRPTRRLSGIFLYVDLCIKMCVLMHTRAGAWLQQQTFSFARSAHLRGVFLFHRT